ncbi:MAG: hypothetical protein D6795_13390 [Deltaproteobacteria bacterium]|nr:MAG: hypothetical protein D6795_13390 [Deltaproteobacteria bacterium]
MEGLERSLYRHSSVPGGRGCGDGDPGTPGNVLLGEEYAYNGGEGGKGGGPFGGQGGKGGIGGWIIRTPRGVRDFPPGPGENGHPGGYAAPEINGDTSRDIRVWMGSGGGGGGGGGGTAQLKLVTTPAPPLIGGGGGGAGNPGGGAVELIAEETITVKGEILTRGCISTTGDGHGGNDPFSEESPPGRGGSANEVGLSRGRSGGGLGGPGAGGGILLLAPFVEITGTLDTRGGGGYTQNGGTVKIFLADPEGMHDLQTVLAGRLYVGRIEKAWKDAMEGA